MPDPTDTAPAVEDSLPPIGAFLLTPDGPMPVEGEDLARWVQGLAPRSVAADWDADQLDDRPLTVWEAIAEVTRQIGAVEKTGTADQRSGGYKFRGIDGVLAALHPILGEVGLVLLPGEVVESVWETRATSGANLNVARLRVRYSLVGPDGSMMTGEAWGEGGDTGDKATQKAHSQSYKSFAIQTFSIPTEESAADEPDATNPPSRPFTAEEVEAATRAWEAASEATTVEKLAQVRARAVRRLNVPVRMLDESLVPLSVLFDQRRTELERAAGAES